MTRMATGDASTPAGGHVPQLDPGSDASSGLLVKVGGLPFFGYNVTSKPAWPLDDAHWRALAASPPRLSAHLWLPDWGVMRNSEGVFMQRITAGRRGAESPNAGLRQTSWTNGRGISGKVTTHSGIIRLARTTDEKRDRTKASWTHFWQPLQRRSSRRWSSS